MELIVSRVQFVDLDSPRLSRDTVDWENLLDQMSCNSYLQLLAEMRSYFPQPRYILSSALSADTRTLHNLDLRTASQFLDLINLMSYDFAGPWDSFSGHASQVRAPAVITDANAHCTTVLSALRYYITMHQVHPSKIMLGIPTFGRSFVGASTAGDVYTGFGGQSGIFPYADLPRRDSIEEYDGVAQAAYCKGGDGGFVTYDVSMPLWREYPGSEPRLQHHRNAEYRAESS